MPPKKRSTQTRPARNAKRARVSEVTEVHPATRSQQADVPPPEQLMAVNLTALSASISSAVKQAMTEALEEESQKNPC